jgi:hypothetical protein
VSVPFVDYGQLSQMSGSEDLFGRAPDNVVILYWKTRPQFGHWTALIRDPAKKTIEHFDPLGFPLDLLLTKLPQAFRRSVGQDSPWLSMLLRHAASPEGGGWTILNNAIKFQELQNKDANSCGRWTGLRIAYHQKGMCLAAFQLLFDPSKKSAMTNDRWSSTLSMFVK